MTKVDAANHVIREITEEMEQRNDRMEYAHLKQELLRRVDVELAKARADEASYGPTP
jgi:hypothetical protein